MIKFRDIEDAFDFVSSDQPFMNSAIIHKTNGDVFYQSEMSDMDEFPDDADDGDYISIPHKNDLELGRQLVFDFVSNHLPQKSDEVHAIFRSKGAYSRYKFLLDSMGLLDEWYQFEDEQTKSALRQWCEENDLRVGE